ncbi:PREDICTED: coiled-coil domain-containing protein 71-like [Chinchilla lanigera]|uniref:coiled-coil domain-containing protein 71-like n=1 Tax=Chinchilla lanigera TaxID=34839 RepID=UPI0006987634|nr:PREDICTED: coiled-coil domain-containing protein 71-like [Chinchilla lanigera]
MLARLGPGNPLGNATSTSHPKVTGRGAQAAGPTGPRSPPCGRARGRGGERASTGGGAATITAPGTGASGSSGAAGARAGPVLAALAHREVLRRRPARGAEARSGARGRSGKHALERLLQEEKGKIKIK